jgi:hypothetical protein
MKNDGSRPSRFDMIANQMMKGINGSKRQGNTAGTEKEIEEFQRVYGETITYLDKLFPKSMNVSVGVPGALGKAILWYGKEKMQPFAEAVAKREFKGRLDPCHALWEWLIRHPTRDTNEVYRRTVTAIRIFLRGGEFKGHLKPALDDIFEWQDNYRVMRQPKRNQHTSDSNRSPVRQTQEAIMADVEDLLSGHPT